MVRYIPPPPPDDQEAEEGLWRVLGELGASTCRVVDLVRPAPVWDVNGYYSSLGVTPAATKADLRHAYLDSEQSMRQTFCLKQLLDREVRARYDAVPLGEFFLDEEVIRRIRRRLLLEETVSGLDQDEQHAEEGLDSLAPEGEDHPVTPEYLPLPDTWGWGYYLRGDPQLNDPDSLRAWQEALVSTLGRRGIVTTVALGLARRLESDCEVEQMGSEAVVWITEGLPVDPDLVQYVASLVERLAPRVVPASPPPESPGESDTSGDKRMSAETAVPAFRSGAKQAKEATKSASLAKDHYLGMKDQEEAVIRILTPEPEWIVVDQHNNVSTKPKPKNYEGNWPAKMSAVCRKDPAFAGIHDSCYLCENPTEKTAKGRPKGPTARTWAYAVLREEVYEDGQIVGYRDKVREVTVEEDGKEKTIKEKAIVMLNLGYKNFFSLLEGFANRGMLLDRDYWIKRNGDDTDTTYQIVPNDPITTADGEVFDVSNPKFGDRYKPHRSLAEVVMDKASDEFYARFFDPSVEVDEDGKVVPAGTAKPSSKSKGEGGSSETPTATEEENEDRLKALASRVTGYGKNKAKDAETEEESEPEAEETAEETEVETEAEEAPAKAPAKKAPAKKAAAASGGMRDFD